MKRTMVVVAALLASGCNQSAADPEFERVKQSLLMKLREHRTAEFADVRRCPSGQGYTGTISAGNGTGGRSEPRPFIIVPAPPGGHPDGPRLHSAIMEDNVADAERIVAGSHQPGRFDLLRPRCFGQSG
jgi:hypothetical protein